MARYINIDDIKLDKYSSYRRGIIEDAIGKLEQVEIEENDKYILQKCIDGEWWYVGTYSNINSLCESSRELGQFGIRQVRVIIEKNRNINQ